MCCSASTAARKHCRHDRFRRGGRIRIRRNIVGLIRVRRLRFFSLYMRYAEPLFKLFLCEKCCQTASSSCENCRRTAAGGTGITRHSAAFVPVRGVGDGKIMRDQPFYKKIFKKRAHLCRNRKITLDKAVFLYIIRRCIFIIWIISLLRVSAVFGAETVWRAKREKRNGVIDL